MVACMRCRHVDLRIEDSLAGACSQMLRLLARISVYSTVTMKLFWLVSGPLQMLGIQER